MIRSRHVLGWFACVLLLPGYCRGQAAKETALDVSYQSFTDVDVQRMASPQKLEILVMRGQAGYGSNQVTDAGIAHLVRCKNLRVLAAGGLGLSDRALASIGQLTALEKLSLDSNQIKGTGLRHLAGLRKLRYLNLSFNPIDPDALAALAALPELAYLSLYSCGPVDDRVLEHCSKLTCLQELRLTDHGAAVTDKGLQHLTRLKDLTNVTLARSMHITNEGLACLGRLRRLQEVELRELRSVTPRGMEILGKLPALRKLEIEAVPMDD